MWYLQTDENGYLQGVSWGPEPDGPTPLPYVESLEGLDLSGVRMRAYQWDGEKLSLDRTRLAELEDRERRGEKQELIAERKAMLAATDYVVIKIAEGVALRGEYADVIAQRQRWREDINRLEEET